MNRWAVAGMVVLVVASMPIYLAVLATGWAWRRIVFNLNKVNRSYLFASPTR